MTPNALLNPITMGAITLPNRIVMPPLTRMRAGKGQVPTALNAHYYAQRASAGLIITEATHISDQARGLPDVPGIYTAEQIAGWRRVTGAVHDAGGRIILQIFHVGRLSNSSYSPNGLLAVAPSAIAAPGQGFTADFKFANFETPRALDIGEMPGIVTSFQQAALNAIEAGFDGVEIHGANGYLLEQFLADGSNQRTDIYGGSIQNRSRLLLEVVDAVAAAIGKDRAGVRLSPHGIAGGISYIDPVNLFKTVIEELSTRQIAYLHLIEARASGVGRADAIHSDAIDVLKLYRSHFNGPVISAGGYTPESAMQVIETNTADAVAFGRAFIANPDLVERIRSGQKLNQYDRSTFYGGSGNGYTDYPVLNA